MNEPDDDVPSTYLSVWLAEGTSVAVVNTPEERARLDAILDGNGLSIVSLRLANGAELRLRADSIFAWSVNAPQHRAWQRRLQKMLEEESPGEEDEIWRH